MNRLPDELILMIFDHLGFKILTQNCRLVCKRWLYLARKVQQKELVISNEFNSTEMDFWCFDFKPISLKSLWILYPKQFWISSKLKIFDQPFKANFINLKRMKITWSGSVFDFRKMECMTNLEHLELDNVQLGEDRCLLLPKLKILKFGLWHEPLIIDSECLQVLICYQLDAIKLKKPQTLKRLDVIRSANEDLRIFSSLEFYRCVNVTILDRELMFKIPDSLKEIHLNCFHHIEVSSFPMSYEEVVSRVLGQRLRLGKKDLKIYFKNVELLDNRPFEEYEINKYTKDTLGLIHRNYEYLADHIVWLRSINYTDLMAKFNQNLPSTFFIKFPNINDVSVTNQPDFEKDHLIRFLKNCKITSLSFFKMNLDQEFLDQLPSLFPLLHSLKIEDDTKTDSNYDFLYDFERLNNLSILQLPVEHVVNFLKKLERIRFKYENKEIYISKDFYDRSLFRLEIIFSGSDCSELENYYPPFPNELPFERAAGLKLDQMKKICKNLELLSTMEDIEEELKKL